MQKMTFLNTAAAVAIVLGLAAVPALSHDEDGGWFGSWGMGHMMGHGWGMGHGWRRGPGSMMGFGQEMSWNRLGGRLRAAWSRNGFSRGRSGEGEEAW